MSMHISSDYINFIKEFILLQFQKDMNNNATSRTQLFEKYDNYIKYYHELQKVKTINKFGPNYELTDFFQANHLLELFASIPSIQSNEETQISHLMKSNSDILISFQDYVDDLINIKHINMMEYQFFIKRMKEPEFNKTLQKKYIHDMELRVIKKALNTEIDKFLENAKHEISYLDIMPYYEYKTHKDNETIIKEFKLYEMETNILREIEHFIQ